MVHKLGYGAWDELKAEIRRSWRFRFDWFFKSRMPQVRCCSRAVLRASMNLLNMVLLQARDIEEG